MIADPPVPMWQNPTEFEMLYDLLRRRGANRILEIGAFYGGTLWQWAQLSPEVLVSVDLPVPEGSEHHAAVWKARKQWASWMEGIEFHDLIGSSTDWFIHDKARQLGPYDFMFIDGDHSYEGVKSDFNIYRQFLTKNGFVAFHDTIRHEPGVIRFAEELRALYPTQQFFSPDWGAGILAVFPN